MTRKMKDSGIEWIGEIPEGWEISKVSYFYEVQLGKMLQPQKKSETDTEEKYLCAANVGKNSLSLDTLKTMWFSQTEKHQFDLKEGDLLVVEGGDVASCAIIEAPVRNLFFQNALHRVRPLHNESVAFLRYWLMTAKSYGYIDLICNKATIAHFSKEKFIALPIPVIPQDIQSKIVSFLDLECKQIDDLLSKSRSSIDEYKKLKQAIITQAVTKGVRGKREMKNCNTGWIKELPADWGTIPSKYLFKNSDTKKCNGDEQLTASHQHGIITQKYYTELTGSKVVLANKGLDDWKHVEPFDFIISLRSFQGGLEMSETTGCITWHYIVLKPCHQIYSYYYKWLFKSEIYIRALQRTCNFIRDGQDLRYSNFVQVPLFEPPLEEQKEIADYLNVKCAEIDGLIAKKEQLVKELESYKKSLIYEVVTGKREV